MKIHYEPHPVSPKRKAELRAQGFKIIDARFAPKGWQNAEEQAVSETQTETQAETKAEAPVKRRGRPRKDAE